MIRRRKYGWIGIDFGARLAKIAQLERVGQRLRWRCTTVECSANADGLRCTGNDLRRALEMDGGFHGRLVACVLSAPAIEFRAISVPPGSEAERRAMIAQELEAASAAGDGSREFDYWQPKAVGNQPGESDALQVASIASAKVNELTTSLAAAGLQCAMLDVLPCAIARAVTMAQPTPDDGPVAAIDWGFASAMLSIVNDGCTQFTRVLRDCGAGALFSEVSRSLGLEEADAVELLTRFGLPGDDDSPSEATEVHEALADIVGIHVQRMLDELDRTLAYLRLQREALLPRRALLFGAGATVKNVAPLLAAKLEIPCEIWRLAGCEELESPAMPLEIFGPAAALSALAWK